MKAEGQTSDAGAGTVVRADEWLRASIATPLGLFLAITREGRLEILCFAGAGALAAARLRKVAGVDPDGIPTGPMPAVAQALDAYFLRGDESLLRSLPFGLSGTAFRQAVWRAVQTVPYGRTATYSELAGHLGRPAAARAVGQALAANLLHLVVPCHRVLPAGEGVGAFNAGTALKEALLEFERARQ